MKRGAVVGIAAGAAAALIIGGSLVWWLLNRAPSAEDAARSYLNALAAGDFEAIEAMRATRLDAEAERILAESFRGAESFVADPRIEEIRSAQDTTSVRASAEIAGDRHDIVFVLAEDGAGWTLTGDYLASLEASAVLSATGELIGDSVWVSGALAPAGSDLALLPAEYRLEAAPRGLLSGTNSVALSNDEPSTVVLEASITPEAGTMAQEQIDAYAAACAQPAAAVPADCGLRVPWAADLASLTSVAFRIDKSPALVLSPDLRSFAATDGAVVATATGTTRQGSTGSFTYRADDWALRGSVSFAGDEMLLAVD
ncbi:hypothetical protein [Microbacterium sp.]|uniref:hypothetical protein n=1 Tax=Microbacterium sp. TaxID=51671 RepID=UPI002E305A94|nr:hypothetical protein [Microbacterium sp.]HEX5730235.1 hypothetical protein [Microbacterium sp.]